MLLITNRFSCILTHIRTYGDKQFSVNSHFDSKKILPRNNMVRMLDLNSSFTLQTQYFDDFFFHQKPVSNATVFGILLLVVPIVHVHGLIRELFESLEDLNLQCKPDERVVRLNKYCIPDSTPEIGRVDPMTLRPVCSLFGNLLCDEPGLFGCRWGTHSGRMRVACVPRLQTVVTPNTTPKPSVPRLVTPNITPEPSLSKVA